MLYSNCILMVCRFFCKPNSSRRSPCPQVCFYFVVKTLWKPFGSPLHNPIPYQLPQLLFSRFCTPLYSLPPLLLLLEFRSQLTGIIDAQNQALRTGQFFFFFLLPIRRPSELPNLSFCYNSVRLTLLGCFATLLTLWRL